MPNITSVMRRISDERIRSLVREWNREDMRKIRLFLRDRRDQSILRARNIATQTNYMGYNPDSPLPWHKSRTTSYIRASLEDIRPGIHWGPDAHAYCFPRVTQDEKEAIAYDMHGRYTDYNPCVHTTSCGIVDSVINLKRVNYFRDWEYGFSSREECSKMVSPHYLRAYAREFCVVPSKTITLDAETIDRDKAQYRAYLSMAAFNPGNMMNVLRSAIELKDTKQTIAGITNLFSYLLHGRKTLGRSLEQLSAGYLNYSFGIQPTLADVRQFCKEASNGVLSVKGTRRTHIHKLQTVSARWRCCPTIQQLLANGMQISMTSGRSTLGFVGVQWCPSVSAGYDTTLLNTPAYKGLTFKGTVFAKLRDEIDISSALSLMNKFTWRCPIARTAWDELPFSFLVDWFMDIGNTIEDMEHRMVIANNSARIEQPWSSTWAGSTVYYPRFELSSQPIAWDPAWHEVYHIPCWDYGYLTTLRSSRVISFVPDDIIGTFTRFPYEIPQSATRPTIVRRFHAYQLSTGMALILSNCRMLRGFLHRH